VGLLSTIHQGLGGDEILMAGKRAGSSPRPDFLLPSAGLIVEVDEIQHFTSDRLATVELYPRNAELAFDVAEYRALIGQWSAVADVYRAARPSTSHAPAAAAPSGLTSMPSATPRHRSSAGGSFACRPLGAMRRSPWRG
jgi:hypothetical protein